MLITPLICLDLRSPLSFVKMALSNDNLNTFPDIALLRGSAFHESDEFLLCIKINPGESLSIEPDSGQFLGSLVFIGYKTSENSPVKLCDGASVCSEGVILPAGSYLFNQCRSAQVLNNNEWLDIAIDQQKDGLWERYKPGNLLYIRFLYEDGAFVTQVFRIIDAA